MHRNLILKALFFLVLLGSTTATQTRQNGIRNIPAYDINKYQQVSLLDHPFYTGDTSIDIIYYRLDLSITSSPDYIEGNVTLSARVDTAVINSLFLDLAQNMAVDSVIIGGSVQAAFVHQNDKIEIGLDRAYSFNEYVSLRVFYQGLPNSLYGFLGFVFDQHQGIPVIWSSSEPYFANYWWPCKDTPADKADSADLIITVDTSLVPVSNGVLQSVVDNGNGTHTFTWHTGYPIAQYLLAVAVSNYRLYTNYYAYFASDSLPITNYIFPESFTQQNLDQLDIVPEMLEFYSSVCGQYPFINEKFGHAECYTDMENQTITFITGFDEDLMAHETAHQWFGDKVTCRDWHNIWLNEGFAEYMSALWRQFKYGDEAYQQYISTTMNFAKSSDSSVWVNDITDVGNIFGVTTYTKSCIVLHMLRGMMGDSLFFKTLHDYLNDPELSFGTAVTEDFQRVAESVYGSNLGYFFSEWIYGYKYPKYRVNWNKMLSGNSWRLWLKIEQTINISPTFFTMPVEIKVDFAAGDTTIRVFNNSQVQEFYIDLPQEPASISFDPGNLILKDVLSVVLGVESAYQPVEFSLFDNYPNPFNPVTRIKYSIPDVGISPAYRTGRFMKFTVLIKVFDVLGNEVATLVNEEKSNGTYEITWNAENLPSGVYFYQLKAGDYICTKKMILLK